jgi:hypothetical protein
VSEQRIEPAGDVRGPQSLPAWAEDVRESAYQRAISQLAAQDDLDPAERQAVERCSHRLAASVLAGLAGGNPGDDPAAAARLAWLFQRED